MGYLFCTHFGFKPQLPEGTCRWPDGDLHGEGDRLGTPRGRETFAGASVQAGGNRGGPHSQKHAKPMH